MLKRSALWVGLILFFSCRIDAAIPERIVDFTDFDVYQDAFSHKEIDQKIQKYLEKDPQIRKYYRLTEKALYIGDLSLDQRDYVLFFSQKEKDSTPIERKRLGLQGRRIAIDPGHFGGIYAQLEKRSVKISDSKEEGEFSTSLDEGTLSYLTALELKRLLEEAGATVLITRSAIGEGVIQKPFFLWLQEHPELWSSDHSLPKIFRVYYNREDLYLRAEKINAFHPDVAVIIHYNTHLTEEEKTLKSLVTQVNYNLTFIPGAFGSGELDKTADRYEFLRLLLTNHLEESEKLSQCLVRQFAEQLKVPLIEAEEKDADLEKACFKQSSGIYSRNLALTRLIHSPLCYGETLIQNNPEEFHRLMLQDIEVEGIRCSSRIQEVAKAYFQGLQDYFNSF